VIALTGGPVIGAILNSILVCRTVPPEFSHILQDLRRIRQLAVSGLAFTVIGIASLFQTHVPVVILATMNGPASAVDFGLFIRLLFVLMVGLAMITSPLWPALMRARLDADQLWISRTLRWSKVFVLGSGVGSLIAIALFGRTLILNWTGRSLAEPLAFQVLFGIYFLQMGWSHYWAVLLMGAGRERIVSLILIIEATIISGVGTFFARHHGATGMILGLVLGFAIVSNWILPLLARQVLLQPIQIDPATLQEIDSAPMCAD